MDLLINFEIISLKTLEHHRVPSLRLKGSFNEMFLLHIMEEYFIPKPQLVVASFTVSFEDAAVYLIAHCMAELCA